jgi:hypothetical protein
MSHELNQFYPEIAPFNDFLLAVDEQHQVYVEHCGNPIYPSHFKMLVSGLLNNS